MPPVLWLETTGQGLLSNRVKFDVGDLPETSEVEPNDTRQQANRVAIPSIVNGRIDRPGDLDYFVLKAAAQQNLVFEVRARRSTRRSIRSSRCLTPTAGSSRENDDAENADEPPITHQADSRLEFKVPADGDYLLRIGDCATQGRGGIRLSPDHRTQPAGLPTAAFLGPAAAARRGGNGCGNRGRGPAGRIRR